MTSYFEAIKDFAFNTTATITNYTRAYIALSAMNLLESIADLIYSNLKAATGLFCAVFGGGFTYIITSTLLSLIGFGPAGPIAMSIAAAWQATMGGFVIAGGLFATLQSAAMGGSAASLVWGVVAGAGALVGGVVGVVAGYVWGLVGWAGQG